MTRPTLLGIGYDESSSFAAGAAAGPAEIRRALASESTNWWTESLQDLSGGVLEDAGDISPARAGLVDQVSTAVSALVREGRTPLVLGGDHAITYPVVRALRERGPFSLLHFDAHPDLYPEFQGDRLSHACPFARIMEEGLVTELVQVGIRTMNGIQAEQARRFGVKTVSMDEWEAGWRYESGGPVYLSLDLDVLDPAFAPGVSHPEPGGASTRRVLASLQALRAPLVGADVVELNPSKDQAGLTARVAAKLVKEIVAVMLRNGRG